MIDKQRLIRYILYVILLFNITLMIYYIFFGYQDSFHSDSAAKNLLAQEIFETGQYFPSDWNYVNSDLWVFFGHTFIIPMLFFTENSFFLHGLSGLISAALIILSTYLVASLLSKDLTLRILSVALITSGLSPYVAENLYGQVSYGTIFYMTGFIIFFSVKYLLDDNKRWIWSFSLFFTLVLVFWSNPSRALISYGVPLSFAIVFLLSNEFKQFPYKFSNEIKKLLLLFSLLIFSVIVGTVLHIHFIGTTNNIVGLSNPMWLPLDLIFKHIGLAFHGVMFLFGAIPTEMTSIKTPSAVYEAVRFISALILILLIIHSFKVSLKNHQKSVQFTAGFVLALIFSTFFIHIATTVPNMDDHLSSSRYLLVPILLSCLIFAATIFNNELGIDRKMISLAIVLVFITSAPSSLLNGQLLFVEKMNKQKQFDLINFLESKKLYYGYASFWNAGKVTVFSGNKIRIRQIQIRNGLPQPMRHLSSDRWYIPKTWEGKTFLLLTQSEAKNIDQKLLKEINSSPVEKLTFNDWIIYVFDDNIANHILGWDTAYEKKTVLIPSPKTPRTTGSFIQFNGKPVIYAKEIENGILHFGPYLRIEKGKYRAVFELEVKNNGDVSNDYGGVDVVSHAGTVTHAKSIINTGKQNIILDFDIGEKTDFLELRVFSNGKRALSLYSISLVRI